MAITTADTLIAGLASGQRLNFNKASLTSVAGGYSTLLNANGNPGAASLTLSATGAGAIPDSTFAGCLPFTNPGGGQFSYLGRVAATSGAIGTFILYDRLWHGGSYTPANGVITGAPTIGTPSAALTRPDSTGANTELWYEVATVVGGACTLTVTFTDSAGNTSQTATCAIATPVSRMVPFTMPAGCTGVRQITAVSGSAAQSGTFNLVILRRLTELPISIAAGCIVFDAAQCGMPRVYDSACLAPMMQTNSTSTGQATGAITLIQG